MESRKTMRFASLFDAEFGWRFAGLAA